MTSYTQKAIERAKAGGYKGFDEPEIVLAEWNDTDGGGKVHGHFLLDPLFFQALGKAEGLEDESYGDEFDAEHFNGWSVWHRLIDARSQGKTIEEYFEALLSDHIPRG